MKIITELSIEAIELLKQLIATPSLNGHEDGTASIIAQFLFTHDIIAERKNNNVWVRNKYYSTDKPTILLNSHHDTVKPNAGYSLDPYQANIKDNKLYGLGSNDAGGALVSLLATFLYFYDKENLKYNFIFAGTAEEEISGSNGIECLLKDLEPIDFAIVGEPTLMQMAVAEKGLLVLDAIAYGKSGHAAREEGENAIYNALKDIKWFRSFTFPKISKLLGPVKMTVTMINAGTQHNVIPDHCKFTVDIRCTEMYTHDEVLSIICSSISSEITPRSMRLKPSNINESHPIVQAGITLGRTMYGSPTSSDQALMPFPSLKMGPGDSARSHTADEFIFINEIEEGIKLYIQILEKIVLE